jgi:spore maturation protein CgeB
MRIFYASDSTPNSHLPDSNLWRNNLLLPLRDLGHDVIEFEYDLRETFRRLNTRSAADLRFINGNRPRVSEALLDQVRRAHAEKPIDLLFTYFYDACVSPETIDCVRQMGIVTVNWYCNGSFQLHLAEQISPHYDWCLVPEKFRIDDYRQMGAQPIYCQEAANPNIYKPVDVPLEYDVTFVGMAYGERPEYVRFLIDRGIDVRVWGPGWERCGKRSALRRAARNLRGLVDRRYIAAPELPSTSIGPPLSDQEMVAMYSRSKINLGFSSVGNTHLSANPIKQVRLRDFEVPMSGGFYLVEYFEELGEFFKIGKEIVCYADADDLADKIKYYLEHDVQRERVRLAGFARALRDHTWRRRFEYVFETIGLPPVGESRSAGTPVLGEMS